MKKVLLVDGMGCIYDKEFKVNAELLDIVNSSNMEKILVVNGFRGEGWKALEGNGFEAFSLQEEGLKKTDPEYFKRLLEKFDLDIGDLVFFDHKEDSVETARKLGILSEHYKSNEQIKGFIEKNSSEAGN